ncbi:MAG: hypothetical protein AABX88_01670 [Nanoarchaeota archaeon]
MKFSYEPKWEISDKRIVKLDNLRSKLNLNLAMLQTQSFGDPNSAISLETIKSSNAVLNKLNRDVSQLINKRFNLFDRLLLKDIKENSRISCAYMEYFYDLKSEMKIGKFISEVFKNTSYTNLLQSVTPKNFPHKDLHDYYKELHHFASKMFDVSVISNSLNSLTFNKLKNEFQDKLNEERGFVDDFYDWLGIDLRSSNHKFEFAPAGWQFSMWDGSNLLASIDPERLVYYKDDSGNYKFFDGFIKLVGTHELGHGVEDALTKRTMPKGLSPSSEEFFTIIHSPASEGVCVLIEDLTIRFMKENKQKLNFSDKDIKICELFMKTYIPKKMPQVIHDLLERKETEGIYSKEIPENFKKSSHPELVNLTGVKSYLNDFYSLDDRPLNETLLQICYFSGEKRIQKLFNKMKKNGIEDKVAIHSLLNGFWCSPEAQEKFIFDLYLPKILGNRK